MDSCAAAFAGLSSRPAASILARHRPRPAAPSGRMRGR